MAAITDKARCLNCNSLLEKTPTRRKYCSPECRELYRRIKLILDPVRGEKERVRTKAKNRDYAKRFPRYHERRKNFLQQQYGLTPEEYARMEASQEGRCAICCNPETAKRKGKLRKLAVDHNHATTAVRGLLCSKCNFLIGLAQESSNILEEAIAYLKRYET